MLLTKEVEIKLTNRNVSNYKELGYSCKSGEVIKIKTEHLSSRSDVRVDVLCDYCLEQGVQTAVNKRYSDYLISREIVEKDACKNHSFKKLDEVMYVKHGKDYKRRETSNTFIVQWEEVVDVFKERGYVLLSKEEEYKNTNTKLKYLCPKHESFGELEITYSKLKIGTGCKHCGVERTRVKKRVLYSEIKNKFKIKGFDLLLTEEEYNSNTSINHATSLPYVCKEHKDKGVLYTSHNSLSRTDGCPYCASDFKSGSNAPTWKGGVTEIHLHLRNSLIEWKKESMKACGFKSVLSGKPFNVIHHVYGFEFIAQEVFSTTDIPIKSSICMYEEEELKILKNKCLEIHKKYPLGVCLTFEEHSLFHKLYGTGNNTIEQWDDFEKRYNDKEFEEIA